MRLHPLYSKLIFLLAVFLLYGCSALSSPPRLSKTRVPASAEPSEVLFLPAPTPTGDALSLPDQLNGGNDPSLNPILTVWVNETGPEHRMVLEEMTRILDAEHGLHMEFVLVEQ